ncbi:MAG: hypothetical protein KAQ98_13465, partial [Bacteriovoracaceae bacterium]|nr:hypothetical protein [Bacteriovoracaceae bacterium]
ITVFEPTEEKKPEKITIVKSTEEEGPEPELVTVFESTEKKKPEKEKITIIKSTEEEVPEPEQVAVFESTEKKKTEKEKITIIKSTEEEGPEPEQVTIFKAPAKSTAKTQTIVHEASGEGVEDMPEVKTVFKGEGEDDGSTLDVMPFTVGGEVDDYNPELMEKKIKNFESTLKYRNNQIMRMKELIDGMKNEIRGYKNVHEKFKKIEVEAKEDGGTDEENEILRLNMTINQLQNALTGAEKKSGSNELALQKQKEGSQRALKRLEDKAFILEDKIGKMQYERLNNPEIVRLVEKLKQREEQIVKLGDLITSTKLELSSYKSSEIQEEKEKEVDDSADKDVLEFKKQINTYRLEVSRKELAIQSLERKNKVQSEVHEKEVLRLTKEVEEAKEKISDQMVNPEIGDKFYRENQSLKSMLDISNKRIATLSKSLDKARKHDDAKTNKVDRQLTDELAQLRAVSKQVKIQNKRFSHQIKQLESDLKRSKEHLAKFKLKESAQAGQQGRGEQMKDAKLLEREIKNSEKKNLELTQKLKVVSEKLKTAQKASRKTQGPDTGQIAKLENKIKQVETANKNISNERNNLKNEIAERKIENVNLQKEFQVLNNNYQELERKLKIVKGQKAA